MGLSFFYVPEQPLMPIFLIGATFSRPRVGLAPGGATFSQPRVGLASSGATFSQPRVGLAPSGATLSQGPFLGQKQLKTVNGDLAPYS